MAFTNASNKNHSNPNSCLVLSYTCDGTQSMTHRVFLRCPTTQPDHHRLLSLRLSIKESGVEFHSFTVHGKNECGYWVVLGVICLNLNHTVCRACPCAVVLGIDDHPATYNAIEQGQSGIPSSRL